MVPAPAIYPNSSRKIPSDLMFPNSLTLFSLYLNRSFCGLGWGPLLLPPCKPLFILFHDNMFFCTLLALSRAPSQCSGLNHHPFPRLLMEVSPQAPHLNFHTSHQASLTGLQFYQLQYTDGTQIYALPSSSQSQCPLACCLSLPEFHNTSIPPCQKLNSSLHPSPVILFK